MIDTDNSIDLMTDSDIHAENYLDLDVDVQMNRLRLY